MSDEKLLTLLNELKGSVTALNEGFNRHTD